jgi:hypothetical protein
MQNPTGDPAMKKARRSDIFILNLYFSSKQKITKGVSYVSTGHQPTTNKLTAKS